MQERKNSVHPLQPDTANKLSAAEKPPFVEPKLTWLEPKLVKQGTVADVTAGFFGPFYP